MRNRNMLRKKISSHGGFSYLEMILVTFILMLCTGVITDTLTFGIRLFRQQAQHSQAILLLDTLSEVIQKDLTYATSYNKENHSFTSTVKEIRDLVTQYGTGEWDASKALEPVSGDDIDDEDKMKWEAVTDDTESPGRQIIRRSLYIDETSGQEYFYYTPLTSAQEYAGRGISRFTTDTSTGGLGASVNIIPRFDGPVTIFEVKIIIFDSKGNPLEENTLSVSAMGSVRELP